MSTVAQRVLRRVDESPVPVRTSVIVAQLAVPRNQVWAALTRMERMGMVARDTRKSAAPAHRGHRSETFWSRVRVRENRSPAAG